MKQKTLTLCAVFLLCLFTAGLHAQEALPATGGEALGSGGSASYTVGQLVYTTHTGTTGSVAQGVQQPYEISVMTGIDEPGIDLNISTYPNPTTNFLYLEVDAAISQSIQTMRYQLFDMNGRLVASEVIVSDITTIVTSQLSPATYIVKVLGDNEELKTFKIIKY